MSNFQVYFKVFLVLTDPRLLSQSRVKRYFLYWNLMLNVFYCKHLLWVLCTNQNGFRNKDSLNKPSAPSMISIMGHQLLLSGVGLARHTQRHTLKICNYVKYCIRDVNVRVNVELEFRMFTRNHCVECLLPWRYY